MLVHYGELGDTFYFPMAVNDTSGSANDGASALCAVRLCGASAAAGAVYSPSPYLLTSTDYINGCYEVAIAASSGNGFASPNTYTVYGSITADSQTPAAVLGQIVLGKLATQASLGILLDTTVASVTSPTEITLTAGSDQDSAYVNFLAVAQDTDNAHRQDRLRFTSYTGSTRAVVLAATTPSFTLAVGDRIRVYATMHPDLVATATGQASLSAAVTTVDSKLPSALGPNGNMLADMRDVLGNDLAEGGTAPGGGPIGYGS